jgi:hypothetical protein
MRRIFKQKNLLLLSARTPDEMLSGAQFSCELAPAESYFLQLFWYTGQQLRWTPRSRLNGVTKEANLTNILASIKSALKFQIYQKSYFFG